MNILLYIKENWSILPKSTFDNEEVVIFHCVKDENYGYGHHSYEGYGGNAAGELMWCYSSGCSCNGSCGVDHVKSAKSFVIDGVDLSQYDPEVIKFANLEAKFDSY